jgi:universal stress protein E
VQRAALLCGRLTELVLVDIVHEPMLDGYMGNARIYEPLRARVVAERKERIEGLARILRERGLDVSCNAVWDHPLDEAVARRIREAEADLLVFAHKDPKSGFLHSEWRLVTTCPVPVLVVSKQPKGKYRSIVAAVDPFRAHAKPATLDLAILAQARALQAQTGATLSAVHCFTPLEYFGVDLKDPTSGVREADRRREELQRLLTDAELDPSFARLETGSPHDVLTLMAGRGEVDVIVMGALARGALKQWIIGSSAERVLHAAAADVLAIKPGATAET